MDKLAVKKRKRTKNSGETNDEKINEMLDEIGIIRSAEKASVLKTAIIDLLSPASAEKDARRQSHKAKHLSKVVTCMNFESPAKVTNVSTIDLTTPEDNGRVGSASKSLEQSFSESPELEMLSTTLVEKKFADQFDRNLIKCDSRNKEKRNLTEASDSRADQFSCVISRDISKSVPWIAMEQSLSETFFGEAIKSVISNLTNTTRSASVHLLPSFACTVPNVVMWSQPHTDLQALCIYSSAYDFLEILAERGYNGISKHLQTAIKNCWDSQDIRSIANSSRLFWIIEKLDEALLHHNKSFDSTKGSEKNHNPRITSQDIYEITFQLFEDFKVHVKQTSDEQDSIAYIELITREVGKPCRKTIESDLKELLNAVPRLNAIRVLTDGNAANMFANAWLRMLLLIPGISEEKAQSILDYYPTFTSLYQAYQNRSQSREGKQCLLANNVKTGRIERALSSRICDIFGSVDCV